jgi:pilus assembly protein CpaB
MLMNRRRVLLIVATFVTVLGVALVALYVRGADSRAASHYRTVSVLVATAPIQQGETIDAAAKSGKLTQAQIVRADVLPNAQTSIQDLTGKVALSEIYPGEQIISNRFGAAADAQPSPLQIPDGDIAVSVNLTDPDRVAGFVEPGSQVAVFYSGIDKTGAGFTRLILGATTVLGVGSTTPTTTTTTTTDGAQTTEQLPRTLLTIAVTQKEAQKVIYGSKNGELSFMLMTDKSKISPGPATTLANLFK